MASDTWHTLPDRFPTIDMDAFVIMPNHIHGVVVITGDNTPVGAGLVPALDVVPVNTRATTRVAPTLGDVIGAYKSLNRIRRYILDNPRHWHEDRYNPNVQEGDA
jgi:hypothetical protein